jgi:hypothetical protein
MSNDPGAPAPDTPPEAESPDGEPPAPEPNAATQRNRPAAPDGTEIPDGS